jgi:citrate synthase
VERATGQLPAVDLAFAVLSTHLRLPAGSSTVLFVLGRMAGWLAHIDEQLASADGIRPRARYVGQ